MTETSVAKLVLLLGFIFILLLNLNILYNFDVIKATTRKSVYVINHNIIFKGSIGDFIKEYNKYYENIDVIVNDKGKVVLE